MVVGRMMSKRACVSALAYVLPATAKSPTNTLKERANKTSVLHSSVEGNEINQGKFSANVSSSFI
jgi:hypothetical protein